MSVAEKLKRRIKFLFKKRYSTSEILKKKSNDGPLRLHLGCGNVHLDDWINIDVTDKSMADLVMDFKNIKNNFQPGSVREILMIHSISYLRLWEARDLFSDVFSLLEPNGRLILEFPDVIKCATAITTDNKLTVEHYLEAVRAFYAFDMEEIKEKAAYVPYAFGWSGWHISRELENIGFSNIAVSDPQTHNQRTWRDTRVEAIK